MLQGQAPVLCIGPKPYGEEMETMKKAVVTGSSGFIGKALVKRLVNMGLETLAIDVVPSAQEDLCRTLIMDVTVEGALEGFVDDKTTVFHMSANADVRRSVSDPRNDFKNTLCGLIEVLETARKKGCAILYPSTASIFDVENRLPLSEKSLVKPSSPYAAAKAAGEAYCYAYHNCYGTNVRIARMFSVYGIGMNRFAIYDIVKRMQENKREIMIFGDGSQIRDYLYIEDVVDGVLAIVTHGKAGEDYNLASGAPTKLIDLSRKIAAYMGCPDIRVNPDGKSFTGDVLKWYGDISKIKAIGFLPRIPLDDGLKRTVDWLNSL
jgi:UDP-glucose 4-epimerase